MLCHEEIIDAMSKGLIGIEPFNPAQLNPNSYDVRLGNWFVTVKWRANKPLFGTPFRVEEGLRVVVPCGGTLLAMTKEVVGTRKCYAAELRSKSSTRRGGITVCDSAGIGDIGYWNHWTVELTTHINIGMASLIVGEPFAQVVFFRTGETEHPYQGQYREQDWPACMIPKAYRRDL